MWIGAALAIASVSPLTIGRADAPLRSPLPDTLGGYTARGDEPYPDGGETLYARAAVLRQGELCVAVVALDALTIPESLFEEIGRNIQDCDLFISATHTHSAPDSQALNARMNFKVPGIATFDERALEAYVSDIVGSIRQADQASVPMEGFEVRTRETSLVRGRRAGSEPDGRVTRIEGFATIFSAHATALGADWLLPNGDWPGAVSALTGDLSLPGAIGDAAPSEGAGDDLVAYASRIVAERGERLEVSSHLSFATAPIKLPDRVPSPNFGQEFGLPQALGGPLVQAFAPSEASVTALAIGDVVLVGVPGEPTTAAAHRIERLAESSGYRHARVVSLVNGWIGYVLEAEDYQAGGYEAALSFYGEALADRIVEAAELALTESRSLRRVRTQRPESPVSKPLALAPR